MACGVVWVIVCEVHGDDVVAVSEADRERLEEGRRQLQSELESLKRRAVSPTHYHDAAICEKALEWILRHHEFYQDSYVAGALRVLEIGRERARAAEPDWGRNPGRWVLAYRSRVDDSLQPYAVSLPEGYDPSAERMWPVYVVLHGRNARLNEVSFFQMFERKAPEPGADWIQLDVFGRTNNAYRWAGETDVFEALDDLRSRYAVDDRRITLWGFSMGGAGAWHLGLHHPSRWSSVGAGAGFVDFYEYQRRSERLIPAQHHSLHIYDAVDYVSNLSAVPFITYGGENDPQLLASETMRRLADQRNLPLEMLVGVGMGHRFDDESLARFMAFHAEWSARGRPDPPGRTDFDFTTWTLRYNICEWLTLLETDAVTHPMRARASLLPSDRIELQLENIRSFAVDAEVVRRLNVGGRPLILPEEVELSREDPIFVLVGDDWQALSPAERKEFLSNSLLNKRPGLQGPIDDAFMDAFVCVRGTGVPHHPELQRWADWNLERFTREYDKWMRAKILIIDDQEVDASVIDSRHLILFGDPGSNSVIRRLLDDLPVTWTREGFRIDGEPQDVWHDCEEHAFCMIFPNPLNPQKYVVLNSGMTMHEADFRGSNAWLFPKLGDVSVLRIRSQDDGGFAEEILWADVFDHRWASRVFAP